MITVCELVKEFYDKKRGTIRAVDEVSFECHPGEVFGLLGANGAGKTTLLRMLGTILTPSSGTALVGGYDIRHAPNEVRRRIGYLSSTTALYDRLTPREMVLYFARLSGLSTAEAKSRIQKIFTDLDMLEFADRRCDRLSSGQRQRVSIARAIVHSPPVMIFDEPTNGLDVITSRTIMDFIHKCRDEGRTVIFSTHIMSEAERICDRIGVIHNGRMMALGTLPALRETTGETALELVFLHLIGATYESSVGELH